MDEEGEKMSLRSPAVMNKKILRAKGNVHRAEREREILSMLSFPFLPSLYANFESEQNIFIVTNYCSGGDLNILKQKQLNNKFLESSARFYAAEVLLALEHLHKLGIIYRDLKPENVLIQQDGHVMLTDFDLSVILRNCSDLTSAHNHSLSAKLLKLKRRMSEYMLLACKPPRQHLVIKSANVQRSSRRDAVSRILPLDFYSCRERHQRSKSSVRSCSFVGTEEYVAPEILWGTGHVATVDWWTFGVFLFELVYGITPFKGNNRKETFYNILSKQPDVPRSTSPLSDLILKLLVKESNKRLGAKRGAAEIKEHAFFLGIQWHALHGISRPPYVPDPLSLEICQKTDENSLLKSNFASSFTDCGVVENLHKLNHIETQSRNDTVRSTCMPLHPERLANQNPDFSHVIKTDRLIDGKGYCCSFSSNTDCNLAGQQMSRIAAFRHLDPSYPIEKVVDSKEGYLVNKATANQSKKPNPNGTSCKRTLSNKSNLYSISQSCHCAEAADKYLQPQESIEVSESQSSSSASDSKWTDDHRQTLLKVFPDFKQSNDNTCTTDAMSADFPFVKDSDDGDEYFDIELAVEELAKESVQLEESELEVANRLFEDI